MVPTFGSPDGADLVDLYIHSPSTTEVQSTAAANPWNYSVAPPDAWNQLIEVDGFGTDDWVTPLSTTSGLGNSSNLATAGVWPAISVAPAQPDGPRGDPGGHLDHRPVIDARGTAERGQLERLGLYAHLDRPGWLRLLRRPYLHRHAGHLHLRGLFGGPRLRAEPPGHL
jgi:hypothetical protein